MPLPVEKKRAGAPDLRKEEFSPGGLSGDGFPRIRKYAVTIA
jgi:hypothetical protein